METGRENRRYREPLRARRWRRPCGGGECDGRQLWVVIMRRFKPPSKTGVAGHHRASRQLAGPSGSPLFDNDRAAPDATVAAAQDRFSLVVRYLARSWGDISISPKKKIEKSQRPSFLRTTHCLEMGR